MSIPLTFSLSLLFCFHLSAYISSLSEVLSSQFFLVERHAFCLAFHSCDITIISYYTIIDNYQGASSFPSRTSLSFVLSHSLSIVNIVIDLFFRIPMYQVKRSCLTEYLLGNAQLEFFCSHNSSRDV